MCLGLGWMKRKAQNLFLCGSLCDEGPSLLVLASRSLHIFFIVNHIITNSWKQEGSELGHIVWSWVTKEWDLSLLTLWSVPREAHSCSPKCSGLVPLCSFWYMSSLPSWLRFCLSLKVPVGLSLLLGFRPWAEVMKWPHSSPLWNCGGQGTSYIYLDFQSKLMGIQYTLIYLRITWITL